MKLTGIRSMDLFEVPEPLVKGERDVKIKMVVVGVCGSDIHYYTSGKIGSQVVEYPFSVGHEGAGIVVETGSAVTRVKKGDKVAIEPAISCGQCDQCKAGRHHTCRKLRFLGCPGQAEGCLQEFIVMPEENCYPLYGNLNCDHAAISEPLAIGIYAVKKSIAMPGMNIGILGSGPIGLSVLLAAKMQGAHQIFVTDRINARLSIASEAGASWTGNVDETDIVSGISEQEPLLLDAVFECCGKQEAMDQAFELLKPGGKLMIVGIPELDRWSIPVDKARRLEVCIQNVRRQVSCVNDALEAMVTGSIDVSRMPTHRFSFQQSKNAFDLVAGYQDGVMKAMIDF